MQSHGPFEILPRHVFKRTNFDNAGAVDQNINLTEAIDDFTNSRLNLAAIEQVALNGQNCAAALGEISLGARQFIRVARDEHNAAAFRANMSCKHKTKSSRAACNYRHLAAQRIARRSKHSRDEPSGKKNSRQEENTQFHFGP